MPIRTKDYIWEVVLDRSSLSLCELAVTHVTQSRKSTVCLSEAKRHENRVLFVTACGGFGVGPGCSVDLGTRTLVPCVDGVPICTPRF